MSACLFSAFFGHYPTNQLGSEIPNFLGQPKIENAAVLYNKKRFLNLS